MREILTFKHRHNLDFSSELAKAKQIAEFGVKNKCLSSKDVKHFGLKSVLANQVLRKYVTKKTKLVKNIKIGVSSQSLKFVDGEITITPLKIKFKPYFHRKILKVKHIEIGDEYFYCQCEVESLEQKESTGFIGVDLNSTGHCCVVAIPKTGKVHKLGKKAFHIHKKYRGIRKRLQKQKNYRRLKAIGNRQSRITADLNHKISSKIVKIAVENNCGIKLEDLKGITKNKKSKSKSLNFNLNNWSFYQLRTMVEYKARLSGVKIELIAPYYTSQICSKSGLLGERKKKIFKSPLHGVENADVNAAFNIALAPSRLAKESDFVKGQTDMASGSIP